MEVLFDQDKLRKRVGELDEQSMESGFWDDNNKAQALLQEKKRIEEKLGRYDSLSEILEEIEIMIELCAEEEDSQLEKDIVKKTQQWEKAFDEIKLEILMSGEYDQNNVILSINAGSGGTDAQDWAEMLLRMYTRYAEDKGYRTKILYLNSDVVAGIKSATMMVEGENAYGFLKNEKGIHRLVRISPFDSSGKRHTSFAAVDVMPEINDDINIEIDINDLKIDTFRASGAGGQHVNTTDSAVRITHIPTRIIVSCQNERSQLKNKEVAMKVLMSKLIDLKEQENKEYLKELEGDFSQITWGSQIRSYVLHPYTMVKDHRTGMEVGNADKVLDGDLDCFISEKLKQDA